MDSIGEPHQTSVCNAEATKMELLNKGDAVPQEGMSDQHEDAGPLRVKTIQTKGRFNFMELPAEMRVKIYNFALICPGTLEINPEIPVQAYPANTSDTSSKLPYPSVALLRTCHKVCHEATPILYSKNAFALYLPHNRNTPSPFSNFRWSTICAMTSLTFSLSPDPSDEFPRSSVYIPAYFKCDGIDIIARFTKSDITTYSPIGPNYYQSLSISNWVSRKVMQATMDAVQRELEYIIQSGY